MMTRTLQVISGTSLLLAEGGLTPVILLIEGFCNGTANVQYFLQIHNTAAPVSGTTVPLRSLQVLGVDGFTFNKNDIGLQVANLTNPPTQGSFYIFLSTTDNVFTTPGGGITADINVDIEEYELETFGTTSTGDTFTFANAFTIFADPQSPAKRVMTLTFTSNYVDIAYAYVYASAAPVNGQPFLMKLDIAANATTVFNFGDTGHPLIQFNSNGSVNSGFYIVMSLTDGKYIATGFINWTCLATYK